LKKALITSNQQRYFQGSLTQKKEIIMEILSSVQQRTGRFLSPQSNGWVMISNATARQKIAHSLQYRQRCSLKQESISPSLAFTNSGEEEVNIGIPRTDSAPEQVSSQENTFSPTLPQHFPSTDDVSSEIAQFMACRDKHTSSSFQILSSYSSSHSVKSIEAQLDHHRTYSDHDLSSYHSTVGTIGSGPYANTAIYHPTMELQRNYQPRYPDHQLVMHAGGAPPTHTTQSLISGSELDYRCDVYQYSYPLPSTTYAEPAMDEDRKMPPALDALDLSGIHSLTTILSRQESAEYTFVSYPQYSSMKNSEPIDTHDDDVIELPVNSASDDSLTSIFSDKDSPHMSSV
jgi:hypothetical protein